jgi:hypothetical protein
MATIRVDPRSLPGTEGERFIRRTMRLTLYTLVAMLLALIALNVFAGESGTDTVSGSADSAAARTPTPT